jgi:hypothetical protein
MIKKKLPSDLNTKRVRGSLSDYAMIKEQSMRAGVTMPESPHLAIKRQEQVTRVSPAQIPMSAFQVATSTNKLEARNDKSGDKSEILDNTPLASN